MGTNEKTESYEARREREKREARGFWGTRLKTADDALYYERTERVEHGSAREQFTFRATKIDKKGMYARSSGRSYVGCAYGYAVTVQHEGAWKALLLDHDFGGGGVTISLEDAYDTVQRWLRQRAERRERQLDAERQLADARALIARLGGGLADSLLATRRAILVGRERELAAAQEARDTARALVTELEEAFALVGEADRKAGAA
jgi:hypothetical protein